MRFKFQSFVDISTSASSMQVIQWSVGGLEVLHRCRHLFGAYKYFKLGKISVKMVPASTLPVDPLGLSYGDTDPQTVDPRDQMNPGLVRITNGEDVYTNVAGLPAGTQEKVYNSMMLDPRWSKFMLQSGFRRSAYPLYWQVGQFAQDKYPGATVNVPIANTPTGSTVVANGQGTVVTRAHGYIGAGSVPSQTVNVTNGSSARGLFQVGHRGKLGFLPTDYYQQIVGTTSAGNVDRVQSEYGLNSIPCVSCITCVLPKAYKTVYYYRVFITEEVIFAGLRSAPYSANGLEWSGIDQFLIGTPSPVAPNVGNPPLLPDADDNPLNNGEDMP